MWNESRGIIATILFLCVGLISLFGIGFLAGRDYVIQNKTVSDNCTPEEAIERLASSRESHRYKANLGNQFHIDCMESYDRIANLIKKLAEGKD